MREEGKSAVSPSVTFVKHVRQSTYGLATTVWAGPNRARPPESEFSQLGWVGPFCVQAGQIAESSGGLAITTTLPLILGLVAGVCRKIFCYSLVPVGDGLAGMDVWRFLSQLVSSGWFSSPTFLGGLLALLEVCPNSCLRVGFPFPTRVFGGLLALLEVLSCVMGILANPEATDLCSSGEEMAEGHRRRHGRSSVLEYVNVFDMLFVLPFKTYSVPSDKGSASSWIRLLRSPATSTTGQFLQGLECIFLLFSRVSL